MPVYHVAELPFKERLPGARYRVIPGEQMTIAFIEMAPHAEVPRHTHPQEQITVVLEGEITFTVGEDVHLLTPGMALLIPGDVPHSAKAGPQGARTVEVFAPPRPDLMA